MLTFSRFVYGLVIVSSIVALAFGVFHHQRINDPFVLVSAVLYVGVLWGLPYVHVNQPFTRLLQLFLMTNMFLNGFGTFSYYHTSYHYDDVVHFISPAMLTYAGLMWRRINHKTIFPAIVFAFIISVGWEPMEVALDYLFHTHTYGQSDQAYDTAYDIIMDLSGIGAATLFYLFGPAIDLYSHRKEHHQNTGNPR